MNPSKGLVIIVEDDKTTQGIFDSNFKAIGLDEKLELKMFGSVADFVAFSQTAGEGANIKVLIFDLANTDKEKNDGGTDGEFAISQYIRDNYAKNRVPIFVHSGYLHKFMDFSDKGTVFRKEKTDESVEEIIRLISLMEATGFLYLFSQNGVLENRHPNDLYKVFTSQFRGNELPELLELFKECHGADCAERIVAVFQRMSLRALINDSISAEALSTGKGISAKVNIVEHFYRRTNRDRAGAWTGDIFNKNGEQVYVLTPRCDLANKSADALSAVNLLVCPLRSLTNEEFPLTVAPSGPSNGQIEKIRQATTQHHKLGIKGRVIPPSPFLPEGGKVDFSAPFTIPYATLCADYAYRVTLSDDLANEVAARFGAYLMRPGIAEIDEDELGRFVTPA